MERFKASVCDRQLVADQLHAFKTWDIDANLPDVIGRDDFRSRPDLVAEMLSVRRAEKCGPQPPLVMTYPKDDGSTRDTYLLDPFDDLDYSLRVSRVAPSVESTLPSNAVVQSTRFRSFGSAYGAEGWRTARPRRGAIVDRGARSGGVGGFDVRNHFGSVNLDVLTSVLYSCSVTDAACDDLLNFLHGCGAWPGSPEGLMAGPMASALLGTVVLLPTDRLLVRLGVPYERWVDDYIVAAPTEEDFTTTREEVNKLLAVSGQALNPTKDWYNEPTDHVVLSLDGVDLSDFDDGQPGRTVEALAAAINLRDAKQCRYILGGLRGDANGEAVALVASDDLIWELAPKHAGDYLIACCGDVTNDELEAITARCIAEPTQRTAAGVAHGARVLAKRRVPGDLGGRLHDAAGRVSTGQFRATAPFLYHASSVSLEKPKIRCERSIETAAALRDVLSGRGLIAGLRIDTRSKRVDSGLAALARSRPEFAPTVAWICA